jgi:hypothetical protein
MNKDMAKQVTRITDNELKRIINESTKKVLKEFFFPDSNAESRAAKKNLDQRWEAIIQEYGHETVLNTIYMWIDSDLLEELLRTFEARRQPIATKPFKRN